MADELGIKKDFEAMADFTKTAAFSYSDIHNYYVTTGSSYDYPKVIKEVSRLRGIKEEQAIQELVDSEVLRYLPDGEFAIDVGRSTREGGGINYSGGLVLFNNSPSISQVTYHEYAHSLQEKYESFNEETIKKIYANVNLDVDKEQKQDVEDYKYYLNEMHADVFAYAALMLRAKSRVEFLRIAARALQGGANATILGNREKYTKYSSSDANSKYYASYNVMKKLIRQMWKIRAQKKQKDYFDEQGAIKYKEVYDFAQNIVIDSAYSPKQFEAFKNHEFIISHTKRGIVPIDHNHKKDIIDSLAVSAILRGINAVSIRYEMSKWIEQTKEHHKLIEEYVKRQERLLNSFVNDKMSKESVAQQSIERIYAGISMIDQKTFMREYTEDILRQAVANRYKTRDFSPQSQEKYVKALCTIIGIKKPENIELTSNFIKRTDEILQYNLDNEYFKKMMSYSPYSFYEQRDAIETLNMNPSQLKYAKPKKSVSPFFYENDLKKIKAYAEVGYDVNDRDSFNRTALMFCRKPEQAELLISLGIAVNAQDNKGNTALMKAKNSAVIKEILKAKPDLELKNEKGETALTTFTNAENFRLILQAGANINTQDKNGSNPLMAVMMSDIDDKEKEKIVNIVLEKNIDLSAKNKYGDNALVYAVRSHKISKKSKKRIIENLIANNVNVNEALERIPDEAQKKYLVDMVSSIEFRKQKISEIRTRVANAKQQINVRIVTPLKQIIGKTALEAKVSDFMMQISESIKSKKIDK